MRPTTEDTEEDHDEQEDIESLASEALNFIEQENSSKAISAAMLSINKSGPQSRAALT